MRIKKLTAAFGALDGAVLEPGPGLTVITAPNEAGKSTWAGFWKAMLYGIDTRERDKTGFLADKTRYQPWSGAPMAGEAQVEWQGQEITLRRFPTRTNPLGGFEAVYTASGDPVPGLTAASVGEQLTGVGREAYLRSAFVGQGGAAIGSSRELEARIAALATSGEEEVAYSAVERTLKDWRNRRRANRANGLIPQLEEERAQLHVTLQEMEQARRRRAEGVQALNRLEEEQRALRADLDIWTRIEKHELNRRYGEAYAEWERAREAVPEDRPHPLFGTMSGEEAWALAQEKQKERGAALEENRRRKARRAELEKSRSFQWRMGQLCGGLAAALLLTGLLGQNWLLAVLAGAAALIVLGISWSRQKSTLRQINELALLSVPEDEDWLAQAAEYRESLAQAAQAQAAADAARRRADDLAAQGGRLFDTLELLYPPARSKQATAARLSAAERELAQVREALARTEGSLAHMGSPEALVDGPGELAVQLTRRLAEYDALTTALDALSAANDTLRQRFSPALNRKAGELFTALTGGRWKGLTLARDFSAQAQAGGALPRPALALSTGTAEQLYLAVRLAICSMAAPQAPLVLDDTLAFFDDARCTQALDCLQALAGERQILLFTCHSREAAWAEARGVPVLRL